MTIPAGSSTVNIPLVVKDDSLVEPVETAVFTLSSDAGYTFGTTTTGTISIADNDSSNDMFGNRYLLTGTSVTTAGSNVGATAEAGEPNNANVSGSASVWWSWTAPSNGVVTVSTAGSSFDTTLGVYQGKAVNALTSVASNDDENYFGGVYTSKLTFNAIAGQVYQIDVNGYFDGSSVAQGSVKLAVNETVSSAVAAAPLAHKELDWLWI